MHPHDHDHPFRPRCHFCGRALHVHEGEPCCPRCTAWTLTNPPARAGALDGEPWGPLDDLIGDELVGQVGDPDDWPACNHPGRGKVPAPPQGRRGTQEGSRVPVSPSPVAYVLIAEDDASLRTSLRRLLEHRGYRCAEAADGLQAVELAQRLPPRWVLLDLVLPGLDGYAVARRLRANPRTRGARIHCLTGLRDPAAHRRAWQAGCEAVLTKPVDPDVLVRVLQAGAGPGVPGSVSGLTLAEARELLDWLENQGCTALRVAVGEEGVTVSGLIPPGMRLVQDESGKVCLVWA
jgi:CheY-like chemotaxis protein